MTLSLGGPLFTPPLWLTWILVALFGLILLGGLVEYAGWVRRKIRQADWHGSAGRHALAGAAGLGLISLTLPFVAVTNATCGLMIAMQHDTMLSCVLSVTRVSWLIPGMIALAVWVAMLPKRQSQ